MQIRDGIPLSHKNGGSPVSFNNTDELEGLSLSGVIQAQKIHATRFHMYVESKVVLLLEAESRMVVAQGWEGGT